MTIASEFGKPFTCSFCLFTCFFVCLFVCFCTKLLPTAQRLLDELLSSQESTINAVPGAPGRSQTRQVKKSYFINLLAVFCLYQRTVYVHVHTCIKYYIAGRVTVFKWFEQC